MSENFWKDVLGQGGIGIAVIALLVRLIGLIPRKAKLNEGATEQEEEEEATGKEMSALDLSVALRPALIARIRIQQKEIKELRAERRAHWKEKSECIQQVGEMANRAEEAKNALAEA